jgi:hypothetical protein
MPTVRFLTHRAGPGIDPVFAGQIIEVSTDEADALIDGGFAELSDPAPAPEPTAGASQFAEAAPTEEPLPAVSATPPAKPDVKAKGKRGNTRKAK